MCAELGRKVQAVSGSEAQIGVQGSKMWGSLQLLWWGRVLGTEIPERLGERIKTAEGSQRGTRDLGPIPGVSDSSMWSSDSGFPKSNQQVTVASTRPTL